MTLSPVIAVHTTLALCAVVLGPLALWARLGRVVHPALHRAAGYAFVTCMLLTALSALWIHSTRLPNWNGYGPLHLLVILVVLSLWRSFVFLRQGRIAQHRKTMIGLYAGACVITGLFTLWPERTLGRLIWGEWLDWL